MMLIKLAPIEIRGSDVPARWPIPRERMVSNPWSVVLDQRRGASVCMKAFVSNLSPRGLVATRVPFSRVDGKEDEQGSRWTVLDSIFLFH